MTEREQTRTLSACKDTNKRAKMQINLQFSEREYLRAKLKDTNKRAKMQIYLPFSATVFSFHINYHELPINYYLWLIRG